MSTLQPPSADQLAAARLSHWRQNSPESEEAPTAALLTLESVRNFVSSCGLLLFAPRPQHIGSPVPTLVEATLGRSNAAPTLAESAVARTLLARLIAEGSAVPLNLLGAPSTTPDAPDFIASAATFSYVFTLRGDKAFKQPPSTSGATKVNPLALNAYNLLVQNGPTSAYDLVTQLGKEVTEAAVLRSLSELWQHLRVLPIPHPDGGATLWETVGNRFTKQLKAGANAGQPTALSALISLYLSQSILATESDIETFLSPLAPRSRVRDVIHALTGARQLVSIAIDGKTHLHIHGELPSFLTPPDSQQHGEPDTPTIELAEDGTRIKKFVAKPRKIGTGYVERAKPFNNTGRPARESARFDRKGPPSRDREGRALGKPRGKFAGKSGENFGASPTRPAFDKPWDEERQQREAAQAFETNSGEQSFQDIDLDATAGSSNRMSSPAPVLRPSRPSFTARARVAGDRPAFGRQSASGGGRTAYSRERPSEGRPPRRDFSPREGDQVRPPRSEFSRAGKPPSGDRRPPGSSGFGDRKRVGFSSRPAGDRAPFNDKARRPFRADEAAVESRPPRRDSSARGDFAGRPPRSGFSPRSDSAARPPRRDFTPRSKEGASSPRENFRKPRFPRDREEGAASAGDVRPERPAFRKFDAPRGPRKPFAPREDGGSRPPRRDFSGPAKPFSGSGKPPFGARRRDERSGPDSTSRGGELGGKRESSGSAGQRESRGYGGKREGGDFAGKKRPPSASGSFAGKKSFTPKPAGRRGPETPGVSTFDKFKGGNKPWGKRPPGRKPKPEQGKA